MLSSDIASLYNSDKALYINDLSTDFSYYHAPFPVRIAGTVLTNIRKSFHALRLAIYSLSSAICLENGSSLRPETCHRQVMPGVMLSLLAWMLVSAGFSYYVEHMAGYTLLYGSVAAVVVTLLWVYMSGLVLIMGAEFNALLHRDRRGSGERKKGP